MEKPIQPAPSIPTRANSKQDTATPGNAPSAATPFYRTTVSGRRAWRTDGNDGNPATSPDGVTLPTRRIFAPKRVDIARTMLDLVKMKNLARNSLGHDFRINENMTGNVPIDILPDSLKKQGGF